MLDLRAWLAGTWSVQRRINDGDSFTGTATFTPAETGEVAWDEHGELTLGAHTGPASRSLLIRPAGAPHTWEVVFDDGRPFHSLDLRDGSCEPEHLCGADVYRGRFVVTDADTLTVTWRVSGPGREDRLHTVYRRR